MFFETQELIFFTLNKRTSDSFKRYLLYTQKKYQNNAPFEFLNQKEGFAFKHIQDLLIFLESLEINRLANLIIIIDPYSVIDEKTTNKQKVKELILQYPEVKIAFLTFNDDWINIFDFKEIQCQFHQCSQMKDKKCLCKYKIGVKLPYIHSFNPFKEGEFQRLINGKSNLFDSSNLRNAIKQILYSDLNVQSNFPKSQCSRTNYFAFCVEEEITQGYFNAYSLYNAGYRTLPIISYTELKHLNNNSSAILKCSDLSVILRDYDLQFEDIDKSSAKREIFYSKSEEKVDLFPIDKLRGLKHLKEKNKWLDVEEKKGFWKKFSESGQNVETYFITQYKKGKDNNKYKLTLKLKDKGKGYLFKNHKKPIIKGLPKPVNGIFEFHTIKSIKKRYKEAFDLSEYNTEREYGGHAIPQYVTHIAISLIKRSKRYYTSGYYMLSALLAKEAAEILNGFDLMLMLKSLYWSTVAETKMVTNIIGVDEDAVARNTAKRLNDVKKQINRITQHNKGARKNILNQIFNDVRHICQEKELFRAADVALNELVNVRYGIRLKINQ